MRFNATEFLNEAVAIVHGAGSLLSRKTVLALAATGIALSAPGASLAEDRAITFQDLSEYSQLLTTEARTPGLTIIEASDSALTRIGDRIFNVNGEQAIFTAAKALGGQGAGMTMVASGGHTVCVLDPGEELKIFGDMNEQLTVLRDTESKLFVAVHEYIHCTHSGPDDLPGEPAYGDDLHVLYNEVLADVGAAIYMASRTGNYDFPQFVWSNQRVLAARNHDHLTTPWLEHLFRALPPSEIPSDLSMVQAGDLAASFISRAWTPEVINEWHKTAISHVRAADVGRINVSMDMARNASEQVIGAYKDKLKAHAEFLAYQGSIPRADLQVLLNNMIGYSNLTGEEAVAVAAREFAAQVNAGVSPDFHGLFEVLGADQLALSANERRNTAELADIYQKFFPTNAGEVSPFQVSPEARARFMQADMRHDLDQEPQP